MLYSLPRLPRARSRRPSRLSHCIDAPKGIRLRFQHSQFHRRCEWGYSSLTSQKNTQINETTETPLPYQQHPAETQVKSDETEPRRTETAETSRKAGSSPPDTDSTHRTFTTSLQTPIMKTSYG